MRKLLVAGLLLFVGVTQVWAQDEDAAKRLRALERRVEGLEFYIQEADQKIIDLTFALRSQGVMQYDKIRYGSSDGMIIPAHIFAPPNTKGRKLPALVWVHGGVHSSLGLIYWPMIRSAVEAGYVVIAPEYRGSTGYGGEFYKAIDYGGKEVDDVIAARDYVAEMVDHVDVKRIGIIGWSHGGFITLHAIFRAPEKFTCAVEVVGVADLVARMGYKGEGYRRTFAEQKGFGGPPEQKMEVYLERSPYYQAAKLQTPLLIHAADNDDDVNIIETQHLIDALKAAGKKFEYEIYKNPPGGHMFNRVQTRQAADSWQKIMAFLGRYLKP